MNLFVAGFIGSPAMNFLPRADGTLTREPLRGGDYRSLLGPA